jgi:hypothetical protein
MAKPNSNRLRARKVAPAEATRPATDHRAALNELQEQVLDVHAVCSVVATALDPGAYGEIIRLLELAEKRLLDVHTGLQDLDSIATDAREVANG